MLVKNNYLLIVPTQIRYAVMIGQSFIFSGRLKEGQNNTLLRNGHYCVPSLCVGPKGYGKGKESRKQRAGVTW